MKRLFLLPALMLLLLPACVRPIRELTTFRDPAYRDSTFRRVVIFAEGKDLQWRHDLESKLAETLRLHGVDAVAGYTMLVPTRSWSASDSSRALAENGFDAYLHLVIDNVERWESMIPSVTSTAVTKETSDKGSGDAKQSVYTETVTTRTEGSYTVRNTRIRYVIRLVEMGEGKVAWIGLNEMSDYSGNIPRFCEEIAGQLVRDTVLLVSGRPYR